MSGEICSNCRHWDKEEGSKGYGLCAVLSDAQGHYGLPVIEDKPTQVRDTDGTWVVIETKWDFYCCDFKQR